ncbi:hypothetical protein B0T16DRAFT_450949 [Cercophora newfieldiana]|uniref:Protein kinase domain-containing protein n=1 Tax=Cercophora newfieldiana TaxID=92897 RepID=A0AA39YP77_9PEZI|nr:hypothetical protein B0T16DRAFT_450949 [Cercophora newfieldiana]
MSDPDIFVYLYASHGQGKEDAVLAISMPENKARCIQPRPREILGTLRFKLVVPAHDTSSQQHMDNPSVPIQWKKELAKGVFGVVSHVFNVTTGVEHAPERAQEQGSVQQRAEELEEGSLEYANGGTLSNHPTASDPKEAEYLRQTLSALTAIHTRSPPIVHRPKLGVSVASRDIKPDNMLLFVAPDGSICLQLGDFGLGKKSDQLETFCGTLLCTQHPRYTPKYGEKGQIVVLHPGRRHLVVSLLWSLANDRAGLPEYPPSYKKSPTRWNDAVLKLFKKKAEEGKQDHVVSSCTVQ